MLLLRHFQTKEVEKDHLKDYPADICLKIKLNNTKIFQEMNRSSTKESENFLNKQSRSASRMDNTSSYSLLTKHQLNDLINKRRV